MPTEPSAAQIPELVKLAARAAQNDPDGSSAELVRAWKALVAENRELRKTLTRFENEAPKHIRRRIFDGR